MSDHEHCAEHCATADEQGYAAGYRDGIVARNTQLEAQLLLRGDFYDPRLRKMFGDLRKMFGEQEKTITVLREALEWLCPAEEGFTEAFDGLVERGLLVEVPADEAHRDEWGSDTMYVWAWKATTPQPRPGVTESGF